MRLFRILFILAVFSLLSLSSVDFLFFSETSAETDDGVYVDDSYMGISDGSDTHPYKSIQKAIDMAEKGDTIYVYGGNYEETLNIDKNIKIWGSIQEGDTVIDAMKDKRYIMEITADDVILEDITVSDSGDYITSPIGALICIKGNNTVIQGCNITDANTWGILIDESSKDNVISENHINGTKKGIYVSSSPTNDIFGNILKDSSEHAVYLKSSPNNRLYGNDIYGGQNGLYAEGCNEINISNNTVSKVGYYGIYIEDCKGGIIRYNNLNNSESSSIYITHSDFEVSNNTFFGNQRGITLDRSDDCQIFGNVFSGSTASAIYAKTGSENNFIYLNKFLDNGASAIDNGKNIWYNETLEKGNYWYDYKNVDRNLDGIGDYPYNKNGVLDKYPLGYFLKPPKKPSDPSPSDAAVNVDLKTSLKVKVEDPDSDELKVSFYNAKNDKLIDSISQNPVEGVKSGETVSCSIYNPFNATFAWYVIVNDSVLQNKSKEWFFITKTAPPDNTPPVADANGPYTGKVDEEIQFNGSGSSDSDGSIIFYRWSFGDGESDINVESPSHSYQAAGEYEVTLTVVDNNGSTHSSSTTVEVGKKTNSPPIADANGPYSCYLGEEIHFQSGGSSDPDKDALNYEWEFGDGNFSNEKNPFHEYSKTGNYSVKLTVKDSSNSSDVSYTYAVVKESDSGETPGFEVLSFLLVTILIAFIIRRKK